MRQARYRTEKVRLSLNNATPEFLSPLGLFADRIITDLEETWIDVSDGLDEGLAIYAENAVKAVADSSSETARSISGACAIRRAQTGSISSFMTGCSYPRRSPIHPRQRSDPHGSRRRGWNGLQCGEPPEAERRRRAESRSSEQIRGTALWLTVGTARVESVEVSSDERVENIERWREAVQRVAGGDSIDGPHRSGSHPPGR